MESRFWFGGKGGNSGAIFGNSGFAWDFGLVTAVGYSGRRGVFLAILALLLLILFSIVHYPNSRTFNNSRIIDY